MPRKEKQYHFIYKTTNILNNKFYIGMHSTNNISDGYIGSGKRLWYSINKYGKENHHFEILEFLGSRNELKTREFEIIDEELLADPLCLNLRRGGDGGDIFSFNDNKDQIRQNKKGWFDRLTEEEKKCYRENMKTSIRAWRENNPEDFKKRQKLAAEARKNNKYTHSYATRQKISEKNKSRDQEIKDKISQSLIGRKRDDISDRAKERFKDLSNHPRTRRFILKNLNTNEELLILGITNLNTICKERNLSSNHLQKKLKNPNHICPKRNQNSFIKNAESYLLVEIKEKDNEQNEEI